MSMFSELVAMLYVISVCVCDRNRQLESKVVELEGEIEKHKKAARYIHGLLMTSW